jgi:hypothetical protein
VRALQIALAMLGVLVAVAAATYVAGEQTEVVVIRTRDGGGETYDTKVWAVDHDGVPWVRVANPERFWFQRLARDPHVQLIRGGVERARDRAAARHARGARGDRRAVPREVRRGRLVVRCAAAPRSGSGPARSRSTGRRVMARERWRAARRGGHPARLGADALAAASRARR